MKATTNGRLTTHQAMVDVSGTDPIPIQGGKIYPYRVIVGLQYSWTDGAWHTIRLEVMGHRNKTGTGQGTSAKYTNPDTAPEWIKKIITDHTPKPLAKAEMIR